METNIVTDLFKAILAPILTKENLSSVLSVASPILILAIAIGLHIFLKIKNMLLTIITAGIAIIIAYILIGKLDVNSISIFASSIPQETSIVTNYTTNTTYTLDSQNAMEHLFSDAKVTLVNCDEIQFLYTDNVMERVECVYYVDEGVLCFNTRDENTYKEKILSYEQFTTDFNTYINEGIVTIEPTLVIWTINSEEHYYSFVD